jgi:hypothetical protein
MSSAGVAGEPAARDTTILRIDGLNEAIQLYADLYDDLLELEPILAAAAGTMAGAARVRVHSQTYRLFTSIQERHSGGAAQVVSDSVYAAVQEWGWPAMHIPAQRYVQRAIAGAWPTVAMDAERALQALVDELGMGET